MAVRGRLFKAVAGMALVIGVGLPAVTAGPTAFAASRPAQSRPAPAQTMAGGLVFTGVAPTRVCDTRSELVSGVSDACTGHTLAAGVPLVVPLPSGVVPATAGAVVANVTVTGPSGPGYATVDPTGEAPPASSNLNFTTAETVANLVTVVTGTSGGAPAISVVDGSGTAALDVIVDVEGYDAPPGNTAAGEYHAITPERVADTRCATSAAPPFCEAESQSVPTANRADPTIAPAGQDAVVVAGVDGVPASGVAAVAVNLTVVASGAGYATVAPGGSIPPGAPPQSSSINFAPREVVANKAIVSVSSSGTITVFNEAGFTDVVVDVEGWYSDATGPLGATFTPTSPTRVADTRCAAIQAPSFCAGEHLPAANADDAAPAGGSSITVAVAGPGSRPGSIDAALLDLVDVAPSVDNYLTAYSTGLPAPLTSDVNWDPVDPFNIVSGAAYAPASRAAGAVNVLNGPIQTGRTDIVADLFGYYSAPPPPDAPLGSAATYGISGSHTDANASSVFAVPAPALWTHLQPPGAGQNPAAVSFPLIVNGRVFTVAASPTVEGHLVLEGLAGATGAALWPPVDIGQNYERVGNITADSTNVYTASDTSVNGQSGILVAAYSQTTGQRIWSWTNLDETFSGAPPTVADGVLLVAPVDKYGGRLIALNPADGSVLWSQLAQNGNDSSPAVVGSTAYVSFCGDNYAFNVFDGTPVWTDLNCDGGGGQSPVVSNSKLFLRAGGSAGAGTVLSANNGSQLGSFPYSLVGPAASGDTLFLTQAHQPADNSGAFTIAAEDQATGELLWTQSGDGALNTNPLISNGLVLVGSSKGEVFAFDQGTGAEVWQASTGSPVVGSESARSSFWGGLAVSGGLLVVATETGLVAFGAP